MTRTDKPRVNDKTPLIISALESNANATDQQIATELGLTRQRVAQVRRAAHGPRPTGRAPLTGDRALVKRSVRLPDNIEAVARAAGEELSEYVRKAVEMRQAAEASS